jgi:monoamine oxidase
MNGKTAPPEIAPVSKAAAVFVCCAIPRREMAKIMLKTPLSNRYTNRLAETPAAPVRFMARTVKTIMPT